MRKQNPPAEHIKKAEKLEEYLRPETITCIYGLSALIWVSIVAMLFALLVVASILRPTYLTIIIATIVGDIPAIAVLIAYSHRPNDPLSRQITWLANKWRRPLDVPGVECVFKTGLRAGDEMLIVKVAFHYPENHQSLEVREQLYTFSHAALTSEFAMMFTLPSHADVERALDPSIEMVATEYKIPVIYPEILDVRKMRVLYDIAELKITLRDVPPVHGNSMATGTAG